MSTRSYQFDMNGMSPDARDRAAQGAQQIVHMEPDAGKTMAMKLLPVRDLLNDALEMTDKLTEVSGFGALPTGDHVTDFYEKQATHAKERLANDRDAVQKDIDHFLAMQLLYNNQDNYNAGNFSAYQTNIVY